MYALNNTLNVSAQGIIALLTLVRVITTVQGDNCTVITQEELSHSYNYYSTLCFFDVYRLDFISCILAGT